MDIPKIVIYQTDTGPKRLEEMTKEELIEAMNYMAGEVTYWRVRTMGKIWGC